MALTSKDSIKHAPHECAGLRETFGAATVFQRMRQSRKSGLKFTPSPIALAEEQPGVQEYRIPTYENAFAFAQRTGLSPAVIDHLIENGLIACLRIERDGFYINVRKALVEIENLEQKRTAI